MNRSQADIGITSFGGRLSLSTAVLLPWSGFVGPIQRLRGEFKLDSLCWLTTNPPRFAMKD